MIFISYSGEIISILKKVSSAMLCAIVLVGIGGGIGSIFRYLTAVYIHKNLASLFPWATFAANITGCFIIGILLSLFEKEQLTSPDIKFLFITGFCGGYTTFMTDNMTLIESGNTFVALLNIGFSVMAGLTATWPGLYFIR